MTNKQILFSVIFYAAEVIPRYRRLQRRYGGTQRAMRNVDGEVRLLLGARSNDRYPEEIFWSQGSRTRYYWILKVRPFTKYVTIIKWRFSFESRILHYTHSYAERNIFVTSHFVTCIVISFVYGPKSYKQDDTQIWFFLNVYRWFSQNLLIWFDTIFLLLFLFICYLLQAFYRLWRKILWIKTNI